LKSLQSCCPGGRGHAPSQQALRSPCQYLFPCCGGMLFCPRRQIPYSASSVTSLGGSNSISSNRIWKQELCASSPISCPTICRIQSASSHVSAFTASCFSVPRKRPRSNNTPATNALAHHSIFHVVSMDNQDPCSRG